MELLKWNCNFAHMCMLIMMWLFNCFLCFSVHPMMYWSKRTQIVHKKQLFHSFLLFAQILLHFVAYHPKPFLKTFFYGLFFHTHEHYTWWMDTPWFISALSIPVKGVNIPESIIWSSSSFSYNCPSHSLQLLLQLI